MYDETGCGDSQQPPPKRTFSTRGLARLGISTKALYFRESLFSRTLAEKRGGGVSTLQENPSQE